MEYRRLGSSELEISCLSLGGNIFGHFCDKQETQAIIDTAGELGINCIDTADVYSDGASEELIGQCVGSDRQRWIIATKVGVNSNEHPGGKGRRAYIFDHIEHSLRRLGTDYVDLYQMHHFDPDTPLDETVDALDALVKQGKVRQVGACNYSGQRLSEAHGLAVSNGAASFATIQTSYNAFKRQAEEDVFPVCRESGMSALVYGALARGVLTGKYATGVSAPTGSRATESASISTDLTAPVLNAVGRLTTVANAKGVSVTDLALAWAVHRPEVCSLIVGVRDPAQLEANAVAMDVSLTTDDISGIEGAIGDRGQFAELSLGTFPRWE
jgi:aryl-alcohol dehydrogenase-like predicted oxidoreductase